MLFQIKFKSVNKISTPIIYYKLLKVLSYETVLLPALFLFSKTFRNAKRDAKFGRRVVAFRDAVPVCALLKKNFQNGVPACFVTKVPLLSTTLGFVKENICM
jgi:hypothetical protein